MPTGWLTGSWASPLAALDPHPRHIVYVDGVAVLALTADSATGFTGTPPADDGNLPTVHVPTGAGGTGGAAPTGAGGSAPPGDGDDGGCGCYVKGGSSRPAPLLSLLAVLAAVPLARRRR